MALRLTIYLLTFLLELTLSSSEVSTGLPDEEEMNYELLTEAVLEEIKPELDDIASELNSTLKELRSELDDLNQRLNKTETNGKRKILYNSILDILIQDLLDANGSIKDKKLKNLIETLKKLKLEASDLKHLAVEYLARKEYTRSIALYYLSGKVVTSSGNYGASYKQETVEKIRKAVKQLTSEKATYEKEVEMFVIPLMTDLHDDIDALALATPEEKVLRRAWCLKDIGLCYLYFGHNKKSLEYSKEAIQLMKDGYGDGARNYRVQGLVLNNAGYAMYLLGKHKRSKSYYEAAISAMKQAKDFPSEEARRQHMRLPETNIKFLFG